MRETSRDARAARATIRDARATPREGRLTRIARRRRLARKVDVEPPAPTPRERAREGDGERFATRRASAAKSASEARERGKKGNEWMDARQRLKFGERERERGEARSPNRGRTAGGERATTTTTGGGGNGRTSAQGQGMRSPDDDAAARESERRRESERAAREENARLREALEEAERKAKASAEMVVELQERVRALREENVGEARVLTRLEAQLRRREHEFEAHREMLSSQLEAAIYSANERDNEALARDQEARDEVRAAKMVASQYVLDDAQRREFSLKAGWCARYFNLMIALGLAPIDEDIKQEAETWTRAFGIALEKDDTHASIARKIGDVLIEAGAKPVASYEVDTSLVTASASAMDTEEPVENDENGVQPDEHAGPTHTSLPPSLNPSWPRNFRDALGVEIAMRYLASSRIEERVVVSLADARRASVISSISRNAASDDDSSALSDHEIHEFHFRRAWLRFMWARVREAGMDAGVADEREEHWLSEMQTMTNPNMRQPLRFKRDALAVDKGLKELRAFLVESRLWR